MHDDVGVQKVLQISHVPNGGNDLLSSGGLSRLVSHCAALGMISYGIDAITKHADRNRGLPWQCGPQDCLLVNPGSVLAPIFHTGIHGVSVNP